MGFRDEWGYGRGEGGGRAGRDGDRTVAGETVVGGRRGWAEGVS